MSPRVSIVIPAYNNADFIEQTVESVLAQSFTDFELLIANHSSTDDTLERIQRFTADPRVRLMETPTGGGAPRNWNRVTDEAAGELIKLVCADDLLYPTLVERQVAAFDAADDGVVLVAAQRDLIDGSGAIFLRARGLSGLHGRIRGGAAIRATVRSGANPMGEPACVLIRRSTLVDAGGWDRSREFYIDAGTYANVLLRGDLVGIPEPLAAFRVGGQQWSVRLAAQQLTQAKAFNQSIHEVSPGDVRARDVRLGNLLARKAALQRRLAYAWLGRRRGPL